MAVIALFVYGTLRSDGPRAGLLGGLEREPAVVRGALYHLPAGYPALCLEGEGEVRGELVHGLGAERLAVLDLYEGVAEGLYRRVEVRARVGLSGLPAQTYVMDRPWARGGRLVRSGWWRPRGRVVR